MSSQPPQRSQQSAWAGPPGVVSPLPTALPRRRGRPLEMSREQLIQRIQELAARDGGLFRIHRMQSGLYARARRLFGTWSAAVAAAGVDYRSILGAARRRAAVTRKQNARKQAIRKI